jgi:phenylalanyl-tRNA synthetase beta chain
VTDTTKRILYFIDNNDVNHIRETSMKLGIRTEAAQLNEKGIDPELAYDAMLYGIQLFKDIADATIISDIIDIYPEKNELHKTAVSNLKVQQYLGVPLPVTRSAEILRTLGFQVTVDGEMITAVVPSFRSRDVSLPEDLIEEIARVYGYHNIPNRLPPLQPEAVPTEQNYFYWEKRVKDALKYWGFTEVYTYSMIPEDIYEGSLEEAVTIENPLSEEFVYMRTSLIMSLLKVLEENKARDRISVFEIANVYYRRDRDLPQEIRFFSGVIKKPGVSFFEVKGIIEQLAYDLGIDTLTFKGIEHGSIGAEIYLRHEKIGEIEILDHNIIDFELNFDLLLQHATLKKTYTPLAKYPPVIEDMAFILDEIVLTEDVIKTIAEQSMLIVDVSLLDRYQDSRTFHIVYQDREKNLKTDDIAPIRAKISQILQKKFNAKAKM